MKEPYLLIFFIKKSLLFPKKENIRALKNKEALLSAGQDLHDVLRVVVHGRTVDVKTLKITQGCSLQHKVLT